MSSDFQWQIAKLLFPKRLLDEIKERWPTAAPPAASPKPTPSPTPSPTPTPTPTVTSSKVVPNVSWISQFATDQGFVNQGNRACLEACEAMLKGAGVQDTDTQAREPYSTVAHHATRTQEVFTGAIDKTRVPGAVQMIDADLDRNRPVIVGVNHDGNASEAPDHWIVVYGRDVMSDGTVQYRFYDPGTQVPSKGTGTLTYNQGTSEFARESTPPGKHNGEVVGRRYDVVAVRHSQPIPATPPAQAASPAAGPPSPTPTPTAPTPPTQGPQH